MLTLRQAIARALERESLTLRELSKRFKVKEKEALHHLEHVARSARSGGLIVQPAACEQCGYLFKKRTRLTTPGRCPRCKSERILAPLFYLERHES